MLDRMGKQHALKPLYESLGHDKFMLKLDEILEGDKPLGRPEDFSIKEIHEAVDTTAFPTIIGTLISKKIMDSFQARTKVGDELTTKFTSRLQTDKITGVYEAGTMEKVKEGMPYEHVGDIKEKWVQITGDKYGKILDITEETILFDLTGQIMKKAADIGEGAAEFREKHILNTIQDVTAYKAYYPSGTETDLYSAGHSNVLTNKLEDHSDLDAAFILLGGMTKENGDPIVADAKTILVPIALYTAAMRLYKSSVVVGGANAEPNPFAGRFNPIESPYLDTQSTTAWYLGDFKKEFIWKEIFPLQVQTRKSSDNDAMWERDIKAQYKVRYFGKCGALDYRYVVQSDGTV